MNYRIDPANNLTRDDIIRMALEGKYDELIKMDQLRNIHSTDKGFPLYPLTEGKINFAPTFKYDIGFNRYDTSEKQRIPSWCDRVRLFIYYLFIYLLFIIIFKIYNIIFN